MTIQDIQIRNTDGDFESLKLPITNGGTSATNASDAITNLGVYALKNGIEIPANANITNYTTIGNYYCPATATAKTLQNCPTTVAFTMRVYYATGSGYIAQEIEEYNSGAKWRRVYDDYNKAWGSWVLMKSLYPVGAIYISYVSTSPATLFGGTWTQITNRFLRAANNTSTGGSDTQTLSVANLPAHSHNAASGLNYIFKITNTNTWPNYDITIAKGGPANTWFHYTSSGTSVGSGTAHNNMPAYQDIYCWRRTA